MNRTFRFILSAVILLSLTAFAETQRWTAEKANAWYQQQSWLVGSNYIPANAINELEMWQAETFDPQQIDKELGWAQGLGMNTMRVFLHDLPWKQDPAGFKQADRYFSDHCLEAQHQAVICALRFLLGPNA